MDRIFVLGYCKFYVCVCGLVGGVTVSALDVRLKCSGFDPGLFRFYVPTLGKLFTRMRLCHQAVNIGTGQRAVMPCGWEGNRRSDVALVMRHRLQWFIHLRAHGLRKGDEHPAYTTHGVGYGTLFLNLFSCWFRAVD